MKIDKKVLEAEWVDYKDARLHMRPLPVSANPYQMTGNMTIADYAWQVFDYCVIGWEGFEDDKGNELKFNADNKRLVFDVLDDISNFVMEQHTKLKDRFQDEVKN